MGASASGLDAPTIKRLSPDDISILFPAPRQPADMARLIAVQDISASDAAETRSSVWTEPVFQTFVALANGDTGRVAGTNVRMSLAADALARGNWFVAGIRIDSGAPGPTPGVMAQFGQLPQIRLIAQPVVVKGGTVEVLDTAAHLIFDFGSGADAPAQPGCFQRPKPDNAAFARILADIADLRTKLEAGGFAGRKIVTAGRPLGVHPGLADPVAGIAVRDAIKQILERHLSRERLGSMAVMTLPGSDPEPWMFLSMLRVPPGAVPQLPNGGFVPVPSPAFDGASFAVAFSARNGFEVLPRPSPNNLNPTTCRHAALRPPLPVAGRKGRSTAELFTQPAPPAQVVRTVADLVADPARSHFFNTDCVSCHTETRRTMALVGSRNFPGLDSAVLPQADWNVRNFGWFPARGAPQETVTRRTAAETAAVLEFINLRGLLNQARNP